ncbi:uncharacterized protein LOC110399605 [Numida meleagris]|uniref:uncharacterized protein LOC110399605 n=1 Tax=Numida meleagris TaxID=8996 RepID=UPI000B3D980C|nr:uncharacterized protein LOC110399605 [Numida meleagris]XP_021254272.1 uncharacterized protein LOC110399605 [Numida meleagris]
MSSDPSCQPSAPMEALYSALEGEIDAFVGCVQQCQHGFNLRTLYNVLLLVLPHSPSGRLESWEDLEQLSKHLPGSPRPDVCSYVGWLGSYLQHLRAMKERFDTRVVFPLCEHLYVHEELLPPASIPCLAALLFTRRRNWALLLRGGMLHERVFSPRSLRDLRSFANAGPMAKVLRLLPDIFHQSLATAELARQWVQLHRSRYSLCPPPGSVQPSSKAPRPPGSPIPVQLLGAGSSAGVLRARLQESREELLALLPRAERAAALHAQICSVTRRIRALRLQLQCQGTEPRDAGRGGHPPPAAPKKELQKHLELEEYHRGILEADWLLELEVRPVLIHRINAVQQRCWHLERMLWDQVLAVPQREQPWNRMTATPAQPSATCPIPAGKPSPRSSQQHRLQEAG